MKLSDRDRFYIWHKDRVDRLGGFAAGMVEESWEPYRVGVNYERDRTRDYLIHLGWTPEDIAAWEIWGRE